MPKGHSRNHRCVLYPVIHTVLTITSKRFGQSRLGERISIFLHYGVLYSGGLFLSAFMIISVGDTENDKQKLATNSTNLLFQEDIGKVQ